MVSPNAPKNANANANTNPQATPLPPKKEIPKGVTVAVGDPPIPAGPFGGMGGIAEAMKNSAVHSPDHYTQGKRMELIDLTADLPFWQANAIKYIYRMNHKGNAMEDLAKARKYLDFGERLLKGEPISDTLRNQIHDWENPGLDDVKEVG